MRSFKVVAIGLLLAGALSGCNCGTHNVQGLGDPCDAKNVCSLGLACVNGKCVQAATDATVVVPDTDAGHHADAGRPDVGPLCHTRTCVDLKIECGPSGDGCGGEIPGGCGNCPSPATCGGGGVPSKCGGTQGCVAKTCTDLGLSCGPAGDGCGNVIACMDPQCASKQCGLDGCPLPQTCGGGGQGGVCGGAQGCIPRTCPATTKCGQIADGCGKLVDCGQCPSPQTCGGGGVSGQCGVGAPDGGTVCVPKTCDDLALKCGPAGDGCGNAIPSCGACTTPGESCGGGGVPGQCGGCVPKKCLPDLGLHCGPASDGCGNTLNCGDCANPGESCGGGGVSGACGKPAICVPKQCSDYGFNCGAAGDGCGNLIPGGCGSCTSPEICGGGGVPGRCGNGTDAGVPPCDNLCQHQVKCDAGTTTVTGRVVAATDPTKGFGNPDPIYNALVYVPNGTLQPFPPGVACDQCSKATGSPLVSTNSDFQGNFTLTDVPAGTDFPLVVQLGRWRRQVTITSVTACQSTAVGDVRLPRNKSEGDIPQIAISTGKADPIECVLRKMGIDDAEFTVPSGAGRVHLYHDNGTDTALGGSALPAASTLYGDATELAKNDMVIFACVGGEQTKGTADMQRVVDYTNSGGRVFGTHYSYVWFNAIAPWSGAASWSPSAYTDDPAQNGNVNTTFPKGKAFADWLNKVGGSSSYGVVSVSPTRDDNCGVVSPTLDWITAQNNHCNSGGPTSLHMTWNAPPPGPGVNQCGRALFSDFHVNVGSGAGTFPSACGNGCTKDSQCTGTVKKCLNGVCSAPMTAQEKILEFMLFDLSSCIVPDVPPPPTCKPESCADQGFTCGPAGDGCGNSIDCKTCTPPATCGGGGQSGVCGPVCAGSCGGIKCGPAGDGCGNLIPSCGVCTPPQICGGSGAAGVCGAPCTPKTCQDLGFNCGPAGDGCGNLIPSCGNCTPPDVCGGGGTGLCGSTKVCQPMDCAAQGLDCGPAGDGCGKVIDCKDCTPPQTCGGAGIQGQCGLTPCTPLSCADQKLSCGPASDGCGNLIPSCGDCTPPETCGGGGTPGVCGRSNCTPLTCTQQGFNCGPAGDGCGVLIPSCGECTPPATCGGNGIPGVCSNIN